MPAGLLFCRLATLGPTIRPPWSPTYPLCQAEVNKSQRMEGSFINKSLLTLGTVIHKLR